MPQSPLAGLGNATPVVTPGAGFVRQAIMFTDIEDSVRLEQKLGPHRYAEVLTRHGELFYLALTAVSSGHVEKHTGDGFMARFDVPSDAVRTALRFQWLLGRENWRIDSPVRVRIGIHQGEILLLPTARQMPGSVGAPVNLAARITAVAEGGQVLLTRAVFDEARQVVKTIPDMSATEQAVLGWEAHGAYLVKGLEAPVEIFEVGERGRAAFRQPKSNAAAQRVVSADEEATLGWRPGKGMEVPKRAGWFLDRRLGEGGFGEVWLARNSTTQAFRVFKFCFDSLRLRSFRRELVLFQFIRKVLGPRHDIATLYEVQLESPPFFLESEFCPGGALKEWMQEREKSGLLPLSQRLAIVAQVARALAAAHSVGVIHKDVKPSNIFVEELPGGEIRPRLADFGIGAIADPTAMIGLGLNFTGDLTLTAEPSRTGTRLYGAPEYMVGRPASILGDIYSLGVLLYQVVIGDFDRPLGPGWQRDVKDPLLIEDIASCVDVDPERRFSSALLLAERLETLDQRHAAAEATEAAARREAEQQRQLETNRRRLRIALVSAAVGVALLGALSVTVVVLQRASTAALTHAHQLEAEREVAGDRLYVADMQAATHDSVKRRAEAARELIARQKPAPGERDRRGWEWFFAQSVLNTGHLSSAVSSKPLRALAVSPDEKQVAVAGEAGEISIWSCDTLEKNRAWSTEALGIRCLAWHLRGMLAAGLADGQIVVWDSSTGTEKARWKAHDGTVAALGWHPSDALMISGGADGLLCWWREDGQPLRQSRRQGPVTALDWRQDGREIAVVLGQPARLFVVTAKGAEREHEYALDVDDSPVAWRPGAYEVAIAMAGVPLQSWNPHRCEASFWLPNHFTPGASAYAWSPKGDNIAVGSIDGKIVLLDPSRLMEARIALYGHKGPVQAMRWIATPHERLLSVAEDGTLRAWDDLRRTPEIQTLGFPVSLADAQWHPKESKLAVMLAGDEVQIIGSDAWKVEWSRPMPPPVPGETLLGKGRLAWSPDGKWLAAACAGRPLVAWRIEDGSRFIPAGVEDASDVQWMADSRRLLVRTGAGWFSVSLADGARSQIAGTEQAAWVGGLGDGRLGIITPAGGAAHYLCGDGGNGPNSVDVALPAELGAIRSCALSNDRVRLAVAGQKGVLLWLDTRTGKSWRPALAHAGPITSLGWHPDGSRLVTVGVDGACRLFNVSQVAQNWVIDPDLSAEIVAGAWSADGRRLMLASGPDQKIRVYDASNALDAEKGARPQLVVSTAAQRVERACALIRGHPSEELGWQALAQEIPPARGGSENSEADLLLAAMRLGVRGQFGRSEDARIKAIALVKTWQGVALPRAVQVAEACALERWQEVFNLCGEAGEAETGAEWIALAKAEALAQLAQHAQAETANLAAWTALRRYHGVAESAALPQPAGAGDDQASSLDLTPVANVKLTDDWTGGENNSLESMPTLLPQGEGYSFHFRDFLQLAGRNFRLSRGRMLPRSSGWIALGRPANQIAFAIATCYVDFNEPLKDTCVGSLFLLREGAAGAVRIPLIYGRNVWDWWTPPGGGVSEAPPEGVAWSGDNPNAQSQQRRCAVYRLQWESEPGQPPVVAVSLVSQVRAPAPLLLAGEILR